MEDETRANPLSGIRPYRRRSAMYRWLRAHHDQVAEMLDTIEPSWWEVAKRLGQAGVHNTKGVPPSGDSVRRVWKVVCRDVGAAIARPVPGERLSPSRITPDARPLIAERAPTSPPTDRPWATPSPEAPWRRPGTEVPPSTAPSGRGTEMLASVRRTLARRSNDSPEGS